VHHWKDASALCSDRNGAAITIRIKEHGTMVDRRPLEKWTALARACADLDHSVGVGTRRDPSRGP